MKWDRDVLGCINRVSVLDQRSVLVLARRISKGEVFLNERENERKKGQSRDLWREIVFLEGLGGLQRDIL